MFSYLARTILIYFGWIKRPTFLMRVTNHHPAVDDLTKGHIIIVQNGCLKKQVCFRCPGGCGKKIMLSLLSSHHPHWAVCRDWLGRPSITPSVRQLNDCRCHFWILQGRVDWCPDSGRYV